MGWGGSTRCGSHFCVANPSHACWSQRQACVGCVFVVFVQHVACECVSHGFDGPRCRYWVIVDETYRYSIRFTCIVTNTTSHMALPHHHPTLSFAMNAHTRGFLRMFRPYLAQFTYLYDISIESYTRCATSHHSSPVYAHCQCCAKSSTLAPLTDHARVCAPPKDQSRSTQHRLIAGKSLT